MTRLALVAGLIAAVSGARAADPPPLPEVAAGLGRIKGASTIELTTIGRQSGRPHTRPIWFVVSNGKIFVQAGKSGTTDWFRNLKKTPAVTVRVGHYRFRARATPITDPARAEEIHRLFLQKYTSAWLLSFVGSSIGRGLPVELRPESVSVGP